LSREVPRESLEFVIKSFGGKVTWEGAGVNEENEDITHQIVDRADTVQHRILSRDYVQPQWVYDCLNARVLIPIDLYLPGTTLPPHLSPFVDDYAEGYIPEYRKILDQLYKEANGIPTDTNPVPIVEEESESDEEERFADDLAAEKEGKYEPSKKKLRKLAEQQQQQDEEEQQEIAESLLPGKKRRFLQHIKYNKKMKQQEISKLEEKRQKLKEGKAQVVDKTTIVYTENK